MPLFYAVILSSVPRRRKAFSKTFPQPSKPSFRIYAVFSSCFRFRQASAFVVLKSLRTFFSDSIYHTEFCFPCDNFLILSDTVLSTSFSLFSNYGIEPCFSFGCEFAPYGFNFGRYNANAFARFFSLVCLSFGKRRNSFLSCKKDSERMRKLYRFPKEKAPEFRGLSFNSV